MPDDQGLLAIEAESHTDTFFGRLSNIHGNFETASEFLSKIYEVVG